MVISHWMPRIAQVLYTLSGYILWQKCSDAAIFGADIDECATGTHDCDQLCVNTEGGFHCVCREGYVAVDNTCNGM